MDEVVPMIDSIDKMVRQFNIRIFQFHSVYRSRLQPSCYVVVSYRSYPQKQYILYLKI